MFGGLGDYVLDPVLGLNPPFNRVPYWFKSGASLGWCGPVLFGFSPAVIVRGLNGRVLGFSG